MLVELLETPHHMVVADEQRVARQAMSFDREPVTRCDNAIVLPTALGHPVVRLHHDAAAFRDHRHQVVSRQRPQTEAGAQLSPHHDEATKLHLPAIEPEVACLPHDIVMVDTDIAAAQMSISDIGILRIENVGPGGHLRSHFNSANFSEEVLTMPDRENFAVLRFSDIPFATPIAQIRHIDQSLLGIRAVV